jgi:hypothetical protein
MAIAQDLLPHPEALVFVDVLGAEPADARGKDEGDRILEKEQPLALYAPWITSAGKFSPPPCPHIGIPRNSSRRSCSRWDRKRYR